ncbi:INCE protein, partial [Nothoprocta ornata]|nr:INCE protein [Nothoprocta ornata]
ERERQRLESLRKKQEAEEQRKQKVEEEKRRRQAEMKQKREERLRKALQARERVEQMEEEKKKRMEQKLLQSDEKVRAREEKLGEEKSKKKLSKKAEEAGAQKQKALRQLVLQFSGFQGFCFFQDNDEFEQQELLQRRREEEVKEKGKRVLELKNLVEQRQVEQAKESTCSFSRRVLDHHGMAACPEAARPGGTHRAAECGPPGPEFQNSGTGVELGPCVPPEGGFGWNHLGTTPGRGEKRLLKQLGSPECRLLGAPSHLLAGGVWHDKSVSTSCLGSPQESRPPKVSENNYGMDLNSDDSTDDEDDPRKPVPSWADGSQLNQAILHQYYHPVNVDQLFGSIASPKLEDIFGKSKPRYFKRTSSAVWHSPP